MIAAQTQGRFQGAVIQVARAAELRVVAVACGRQAVVEEKGVGVQHSRPVQVEGLCFVLLLDLAGRKVGQFRHRIYLIGRRLLFGDALQFFEERPRIALEAIGQIIDPQELHRSRRRLRPAPRGQLQFIAERIARNAAESYPLRRRAAGKGGGQQKDNGQRLFSAGCRSCDCVHYESLARGPGAARFTKQPQRKSR